MGLVKLQHNKKCDRSLECVHCFMWSPLEYKESDNLFAIIFLCRFEILFAGKAFLLSFLDDSICIRRVCGKYRSVKFC
jgi:hypothetical protein